MAKNNSLWSLLVLILLVIADVIAVLNGEHVPMLLVSPGQSVASWLIPPHRDSLAQQRLDAHEGALDAAHLLPPRRRAPHLVPARPPRRPRGARRRHRHDHESCVRLDGHHGEGRKSVRTESIGKMERRMKSVGVRKDGETRARFVLWDEDQGRTAVGISKSEHMGMYGVQRGKAQGKEGTYNQSVN